MTREEILGRIAQLNDLSGRLWDVANEYDCFDEPEMKGLLTGLNTESDQLQFEYARQFDDAYVMQFRGCLSNEAPMELSHYDTVPSNVQQQIIEKAKKEKQEAAAS